MYSLVKPILFLLPPEFAHALTLRGLGLLGHFAAQSSARIPATKVHRVMGIDFPNPVGLAAGLDKNAEAIDGLGALGFGFIEVGTATPKPQPGNAKPRLFRLVAQQAIINRMGFNNHGIDHLVAQVQFRKYRGVIGINIGKNAMTPIERADEDYLLCLRQAYPYADYITINISSPNTKNLRQLQQGDDLARLLTKLKAQQASLADTHGRYVPIVLKIAPDLDDTQIAHIANALRAHRMDGVIATNTTLSRHGVEQSRFASEAGGMSGRPLRELSTAIVRSLAKALDGEIPIIAAGGIFSGEDAREKIAAGASLVQLYSGLIYRGPALIGECRKALAG